MSYFTTSVIIYWASALFKAVVHTVTYIAKKSLVRFGMSFGLEGSLSHHNLMCEESYY